MMLGGRSTQPTAGGFRTAHRTSLSAGTIIVHFGREKVLNDVELYKFNFFQDKFNRLCESGRAEEAIEVLLSSETTVEVSALQAVTLLAVLPAEVLGKPDDTIEPMAHSFWRLLRDHAMWHLTLSRDGKDKLEEDIAQAEKALRKKARQVEDRHVLLEVQPFFTYSLNISQPAPEALPDDFSLKCDNLFRHIAGDGEGAVVDARGLNRVLEMGWQSKDSSPIDDAILQSSLSSSLPLKGKNAELDRQQFEQFCEEIIRM